MRRSYYIAIAALFVSAAVLAAPLPPSGAHVLRGPYAFDQRGKPLPEYYDLDGKRLHTVEQLGNAVSQLRGGSLVYYDGTCTSSPYIQLGQPPYMSFSEFQRLCQSHHVRFKWYIGR